MRIVGGIYKGRTLISFSGNDVRPTPDMVRESIFNIFQFEIGGARFLDLFCGTGAMGIEALSRGAKEVVFIDQNKESISITEKNLKKCGIDSYQIQKLNALDFLKSNVKPFDFIYLDPPYNSDLGIDALKLIKNSLSSSGVAIFESDKEFTGNIDGLQVFDKRKYGRVRLTFFKKTE